MQWLFILHTRFISLDSPVGVSFPFLKYILSLNIKKCWKTCTSCQCYLFNFTSNVTESHTCLSVALHNTR